MIHWLKRLIAGHELDELERLRMPTELIERKKANPENRRPHLKLIRKGLWECKCGFYDVGGYGETKEEAYADWKYWSPYAPVTTPNTPFATDLDVAQAAQEPEGRVRYEFLNQTGLEEE